MNYISPAPLVKSDTIGLVSPSSPMQKGRLESGIRYLEQKGFKIKVGRHVHDADRFLAGKDADRAKDVMDFFYDPDVKAIMATGGGYGAQRILPFLDMELIRANPKWVTGFSDTTALQLGLLSKANLITCTGFVFRDLDNGPVDALIEKTLMACLFGEAYQINEGVSLIPGVVEGSLIGGNLGCLVSLIGTPYQPKFENCILFIEEVWSEPYKIDCMLSQLELAGVFKKISGLIWGQFERCDAQHFPERDGTVNDVITEWSNRIDVPCIKDFPYGHSDRRSVLPIGSRVMLNAECCVLSVPRLGNEKE